MAFFVDLTVNGLLVGLMYALVAVGFVLIYKATSVINFAQGDLMMFAAYGAAVMLALGWLPLWAVIPLLFLGMIGLGFALERRTFRPLIGRPVIAVIMVTIGLSFVLQGVAAILWKAGTRQLPLPARVEPYIIGAVFSSPTHAAAARTPLTPPTPGGVFTPPVNAVAAVPAVICLVGFGLFFTKSRVGIAMRAVADDQQAAMTVGINVRRI